MVSSKWVRGDTVVTSDPVQLPLWHTAEDSVRTFSWSLIQSNEMTSFPVFLCLSDRTVKIWRARGGIDSTFDLVDNTDEVASNWPQRPLLDGLLRHPLICTLTASPLKPDFSSSNTRISPTLRHLQDSVESRMTNATAAVVVSVLVVHVVVGNVFFIFLLLCRSVLTESSLFRSSTQLHDVVTAMAENSAPTGRRRRPHQS